MKRYRQVANFRSESRVAVQNTENTDFEQTGFHLSLDIVAYPLRPIIIYDKHSTHIFPAIPKSVEKTRHTQGML